MAIQLSGKAVATALETQIRLGLAELEQKGILPTLAIVRVGEREDDIAYEKGAIKRCQTLGVGCRPIALPLETTEAELLSAIHALNLDSTVHGILLFRPLPRHICEETIRQAISPAKDVDGITDASLASVFAGTQNGFPPCTAQACVEILSHFGIDCTGKRVVVVGRSLVVGRPAALLLLHRNATVTLCHTKTQDLPAITRQAEIVVVAAGQMEALGAEYFSPEQTVIDVGIHWNTTRGKLCGDVDFSAVEPVVGAITPVPGGVGSVTTTLLLSHVVEAAKRQTK